MTDPTKEARALVERASGLVEMLKPGEWEHWWCGDEHCDCHALEFPLRHEVRGYNDKPARGREVLHMTQSGTGRLFFASEGESATEIDAVAFLMNNAKDLLRLAALGASVEGATEAWGDFPDGKGSARSGCVGGIWRDRARLARDCNGRKGRKLLILAPEARSE